MSTLLNDYLLTKNITFEPIYIEFDNDNSAHLIQFNFPDESKEYLGKRKSDPNTLYRFILLDGSIVPSSQNSLQEFINKCQNYDLTVTYKTVGDTTNSVIFHFNNTKVSFHGKVMLSGSPLDIWYVISYVGPFNSFGRLGSTYPVENANRIQIDQIELDEEDVISFEPLCVTI